MRTNGNGDATLLRNLVLFINRPPTKDDKQAEQIVRHLIEEFSPNEHLEVTYHDNPKIQPPWLYATDSLLSGIKRIESFASTERRFHVIDRGV